MAARKGVSISEFGSCFDQVTNIISSSKFIESFEPLTISDPCNFVLSKCAFLVHEFTFTLQPSLNKLKLFYSTIFRSAVLWNNCFKTVLNF